MSVPKTEFSAAVYRPAPGTDNTICKDHRPLLWTPGDSAYRVEHLVDGIAQKFFKIAAEDDFRISVKRDRIEIHMLTGDDTGATHLLEKDASTGIWTKTPSGASAAEDIDAKDQLQLADEASTIIERVKALWNKCQTDHGAPKAVASTPAAIHSGGSGCQGCHGHGVQQQPTIILHCGCHGNGGDGADLPPEFGDTLARMAQRIAQLQEQIRRLREALAAELARLHPDVADADVAVDDGEAAGLRDRLREAEQELAALQARSRGMAGLHDQADRIRELERLLAERPDAPIGARGNWQDILRGLSAERDHAIGAVRQGIAGLRENFAAERLITLRAKALVMFGDAYKDLINQAFPELQALT